MEPVAVAINMELFEVTEFIKRMMLEVVHDNLVFFSRFGLIFESVLCCQA